MKKILCSLLTLTLIFALCFWSVHRVEAICDSINHKLHQAETECVLKHYDRAINSVRDAQTIWTRNETFLGLALRHTETDDVGIQFPTLTEALMQQDSAEFIRDNLTLISTISQLARMEQPYLFNIL